MCELLVWVRDKEDGGNPDHDLVKYRRGDVIVAMPDGHDWTPTERAHPSWVVLKVPGMSLAEGRALASEEPREKGRRLHHTRLFRLHLDHPEAHPTLRSIAARADQGINLPVEQVDMAHLRAVRRRKPAVSDPSVVGEHRPTNVIG